MRVTRKEFLSAVLVGAAGAAFSPGKILAVGVAIAPAMQFKSAVGKTFRMIGPSGRPVDLVLMNYVDKPNPKTTQFTLTFDATEGQKFPEGTYRVSSGPLGPMSLFLIPTGASLGHTTYRADFNLLK